MIRPISRCLAAVLLIFPLMAASQAVSSDGPFVRLAQAEAAPGNAPACENPAGSMLWKMEADGREIFLFGSIHVGKASFYPLADSVESAFRRAENLVFEVDPRSALDPSVLLEMRSRAMLPAGQTLADVLSPEVMARLRQVLEEAGMPVQTFMRMQPWFVTMMLSSMQMSSLGYLPRFGVENYLLDRKAEDTRVLELESIQEQIGFLEELNAETYLAYTLEGFEEGEEEIEALMRAWQCADKEALAALLFEDFSDVDAAARNDMEALRENLFHERNRDMAADVADFMTSGSGDYFVVVGSGHLLGEGSVIDLLRDRGFTVEAVEAR